MPKPSTLIKAKDLPVKGRFFTFDQNNSGGRFTYDEKAGITAYVIIEAKDYKDANRRAEEIGLYFDGSGDCSCCGNRWSSLYSGDRGEDVPSIYSTPVPEAIFSAKYSSEKGHYSKWMKGFEVFVHYLDGRIEGFGE